MKINFVFWYEFGCKNLLIFMDIDGDMFLFMMFVVYNGSKCLDNVLLRRILNS